MMALSIRQPWAWLIVRPDIEGEQNRLDAYANGSIKDIENRDWPTDRRGRILIHASKGMTREEYRMGMDMLWLDPGALIPSYEQLTRGGFVGTVEIVDCVRESDSEWFFGAFGFVLKNAKPMPYVPFNGQLGFFKVPDFIVAAADQ